MPRQPHPAASSAAVRRRMQLQRRRDTQCELKVRSLLHRSGLRYRVDERPLRNIRRRADLVFRRAKVAVFIDGCFWHGCPQHRQSPKTNTGWWTAKIRANTRRDVETDVLLAEHEWKVVRGWEHDSPGILADRIRAAVLTRTRK